MDERLVNANTLLDDMREASEPDARDGGWSAGWRYGMDDAFQLVTATPTIDAVRVVRCRECRFEDCGECKEPRNVAHHSDEEGYSYEHFIDVDSEHCCSYGERKAGAK